VSGPVITFLSDYGLADEFVGVCHAVIARRAPTPASLTSRTRSRATTSVRGACATGGAALLPVRTVHLAVVDPASARAARTRVARSRGRSCPDRPDNGLLWPAAQALGGVSEAYDIGGSAERIEPMSQTFHGRDLFAPVAGAVCAGIPLSELGSPITPGQVVVLDLPQPRWTGSRDGARTVDRVFGNVALDVTPAASASGRSSKSPD